ncbi:MAG TPA: transglycosylase domain-containing protein [Gaiellaceae bacterium]|nr:transglycosylase domain-containing protein [Gaiellaceae bacterium]
MADDEQLETLLRLRALKRRRGRTRKPRHRLVASLAVGAVCSVVIVGASLATGAAVLASHCSLSSLRPIALGSNSFVFASDGTRLGVIPSDRNRQPLALGQMSAWLPQATIAIEDRRFYQHGGVDFHAIARAALTDLEHGRIVEGGSTITQQLVRNLYIGSDRRTFSRKIKEACLAMKLGGKLSKNQILADYLNEIGYGNHASGIEAAAQTYFASHARGLTLAQAALLAGLPQAPTLYDPFRFPRVAILRRNEVLRAMANAGMIDTAQLVTASASPLGLRRGVLYTTIHHPNFFGYVEQQLISHFGAREVQSGGLSIETTLDPSLQVLAQSTVQSIMRAPQDPAAALVAIDPKTGAIKAMVSYTPDGRKLQFNLATQGHRQAGSSFKPFVLTAAVQQGISLYSGFSGPSQLYVTDPRCSFNGQPWNVHNFADESSGYMNLIDATAYSVNTIFAQLVTKVGPDHVVAVAHGLGIHSRLQSVCSITLGSQPVTPLEMTEAYATIASGGIHHAAQALKLVRDPTGKVLAQFVPQGERVISPNTAATVTYALRGVVERGTGTAAYYGRPAAGKTGTAENFQDAWFCGFVPQLVTCVWVGYPKAEIPMVGVEGYASVFGGSLPARIWHDFMSQATANLPVEYFSNPTIDGSIVSGSPVASYSYAPASTASTASTTTSTPSSPLLPPIAPTPVQATTPVPPAPAAAPTPVQPAPAAPTPTPAPPPPAATTATPQPPGPVNQGRPIGPGVTG